MIDIWRLEIQRLEIEEIDSLDFDDKHYHIRKIDLDERLNKSYDRIDRLQESVREAIARKTAIEADQITEKNIFKPLFYFDKIYKVMSAVERRKLMESLIAEVRVHEEQQPNGQWLKSIRFELPSIEESLEISLEKGMQSDRRV